MTVLELKCLDPRRILTKTYLAEKWVKRVAEAQRAGKASP